MSSLSSNSDQPAAISTNSMRRSETYTSSVFRTPGIKRAPSFGSSRNSMESVAMSIDFNARNSDATSSDEEEKLRAQNAKRARRKAASPTLASPLASPTIPTSPTKSALHPRAVPKTPSKLPTKVMPPGKDGKPSQSRTSRSRANLQRNPSIFGPELPNPQIVPPSPASTRVVRSTTHVLPRTPASPAVYRAVPSSPYNITAIPPVTPQSTKPSRRSRPTAPLPRASLARKISFGDLMATDEEVGGGSGAGLGSAFQLH